MNIRNLLLASVCFVMTTLVSHAQDYDFRVLVNKGQNEVKSSSNEWQILKTGSRLKSGQEIKIVTDGYVGLVHSSGKTQELKSAGTYDIATLSSGVVAGSKNIATKYADFVRSKMSPEEREENRRKYANVTGAATRGEDDEINLYMPTSVSVYNNRAIIRWDPIEDNGIYQIKLKNIFEDVIMIAETEETSYTIDFANSKIASSTVENLIIVNISMKNNEDIKSKDAAIERVTMADEPEFAGELSDLQASLGDNLSSINGLIMAEFYEENDLVLDALTSYEQSIQLSPDVPYFQEAYSEFLMRTGLKQ